MYDNLLFKKKDQICHCLRLVLIVNK